MRTAKEITEDIARHEAQLAKLRSELSIAQSRERKSGAESYAKRKAMLKSTGDWLYKHNVLCVGDIVKVTGSRAGSHRRVVALTYYGIVGNVMYQQRIKQEDGTYALKWTISASSVTEQGLNKITHILRGNEFVPVKILMEESENQG